MKLKFLTSLLAAGVMLVGSSAFALTDAQKAAINTAINAATTATVADAAATALRNNCPNGEDDCLQFIIGAAKLKLGANASIASVRGLVNALVLAAPTRAGAIVSAAGAPNAFPGMKANIAAAAQEGLLTAAAKPAGTPGAITAAQANTLSGEVNFAAGIGVATTGTSGGTLFTANLAIAKAAAEFQRSNQNNYSQPN